VKQCKIAVNSVINWSFFSIIFAVFLYFQAVFIDSWSGITICNQFRIKRPDTWRHHVIEQVTIRLAVGHYLPVGNPLEQSIYLQPFSRYWPLSVFGSRPWPSRVTWRHRSRDHLIPRWQFPINSPLLVNKGTNFDHSVVFSPFWVTWRHRSRDHIRPAGRSNLYLASLMSIIRRLLNKHIPIVKCIGHSFLRGYAIFRYRAPSGCRSRVVWGINCYNRSTGIFWTVPLKIHTYIHKSFIKIMTKSIKLTIRYTIKSI